MVVDERRRHLDLLDHFVDIVTDLFPIPSDFNTGYHDQTGVLDIDWRLEANHHGCLMRTLAEARVYARPNTSLRPESTFAIASTRRRPTLSLRNMRSAVTICETFATDVCLSPVSRGERTTLPGRTARRSFVVRITARTVAIRLRLRVFAWTTKMGRVPPGSDATGSGRSAHHTSPLSTSNRSFRSTETECSEALDREMTTRGRIPRRTSP